MDSQVPPFLHGLDKQGLLVPVRVKPEIRIFNLKSFYFSERQVPFIHYVYDTKTGTNQITHLNNCLKTEKMQKRNSV